MEDERSGDPRDGATVVIDGDDAAACFHYVGQLRAGPAPFFPVFHLAPEIGEQPESRANAGAGNNAECHPAL